MTPSIYINLEDDVSAIATRIKREKSRQVVLVCPKRCFLFSDPINLKLLKKQADLWEKEVFILTMDEKGQGYAKAAGFGLRDLPKPGQSRTISDIKRPFPAVAAEPKLEQVSQNVLTNTVREIKNIAKVFSKPKIEAPSVASPEVQTVSSAHSAAEDVFHESVSAVSDEPVTSAHEAVYPAGLQEVFQEEKQNKKNQKVLMALVAATLLVILAVVFVVLPKATIAIFPKTVPITRDMDISMSTNVAGPDTARLVLPAVKISEAREVSDKFESQGKKEVGSKARGMVRIYNFTRQPINLKAGTTVLTAGSKSYVLSEDVSLLKPTLYKDSRTKEIDPASLAEPVEVTAVEGGESSNLPAGTRMEITNQVFGSRPQLLYAKTEVAVAGGVSRYLSVLSQEDLVSSQNSLKERLMASLRSDLAAKDLVLLEKAYIMEGVEYVSSKPVGTESPTFTATFKARVNGLAFRRQELESLVYDRVNQTVAPNRKLEASSGEENNYEVKNFDISNELAVVSVHFEGQEVYNVEVDGLAKQLAGKTETQVHEILNSKTEIERIDVTLAPSWQKSFPWFVGKIDVKVQR